MAKREAIPETVPNTDVTVPRSALRHLVSLVEGIDGADKAYYHCQDTVFRAYVHDAVNAQGILDAVAHAREALGEDPADLAE